MEAGSKRHTGSRAGSARSGSLPITVSWLTCSLLNDRWLFIKAHGAACDAFVPMSYIDAQCVCREHVHQSAGSLLSPHNLTCRYWRTPVYSKRSSSAVWATDGNYYRWSKVKVRGVAIRFTIRLHLLVLKRGSVVPIFCVLWSVVRSPKLWVFIYISVQNDI